MQDQQLGYLLARQRSGTHAFRSILNTNNKVNAIGEILFAEDLNLNNKTQFHAYFYKQVVKDQNQILDVSKVFDQYLSYIKNINPEKKLILFDIKYNSINLIQKSWPTLDKINTPYLVEKILEDNSPVIHITRYNYLKQYISELIASANKLYATEKQIELKVSNVEIDIDHMLSLFNKFAREDKVIRGFFKNHNRYITFDYDELFFSSNEKKEKLYNKINDFSGGIGGFKIESPFKKINKKSLVESIKNYNDVKTALLNSKFNYCINEVLTEDIIQNINCNI